MKMTADSPRISADQLLSGNFDISLLPETRSKVIKVFVCATCTDTVEERSALMTDVYPRLREYCQQNYGLEFQLVDPRIGVDCDPEDQSADRALCMQQLHLCQRDSVGPNCVVLLGQRYGVRALPPTISSEHFSLLCSALRRHRGRQTRDIAQLELWYTPDSNNLPPVYRLQTVTVVQDKLPPQTSLEKAVYGERGQLVWKDVRETLSCLLKKGIEFCLEEGSMSTADAFNYLASDFEKEIRQGLMHAPEPFNTCQVYVRNIVDLKNYISHHAAPNFLELLSDTDNSCRAVVDEESEKDLLRLKNEDIKRWVPGENIHEYNILWKHDTGVNKELHMDYIQKFCADFERNTTEMIDRIGLSMLRDDLPLLHEENYQHWLIAKECCSSFVGRENMLDVVRSYITSNDCRVLAIHGPSGSGKSSLIAKAASQVCGWMSGDVFSLVRFIGTTSSSFDIRQLLHLLCLQLGDLLGHDINEIPNVYKDLQSYFFRILETFPEEKNLVILLDSLHMLAPQYNAYYLSWLPTKLRENVKIVVSTEGDSHGILHALRKTIIDSESNYIEMIPMDISDAVNLLHSQLGRNNKTISVFQEREVSQAILRCGTPLYIKLLANDARYWNSMTVVDVQSLPHGYKQYADSFFNKLEYEHGKLMVSRSLAYLTASTTGLSDCEIEDILSLDDSVLGEVSNTFKLNMQRVPPIAWMKLKNDVSAFLDQRECEGISVNFWAHTNFVEVTREKYLKDEEVRKDIHSALADYYLGVWAEKKKPNCSPSPTKNTLTEDASDRFVPHQPLTFKSFHGETRYNRRKYNQVPRHLYLAGRLDELNKLVLFSYDWLYNKTKALSIDSILADFVLNPGVEATLVERALRDAQPFIERNIDNMGVELTGRLLAYYKTHSNIRKLIHECDSTGLMQCALIPNFPYHQVPGSPLKYTLESIMEPDTFGFMGEDDRYILCKHKDDPTVQIFDLATGEHKDNITTSIGMMYVTPCGDHVVIVDHLLEKSIKIHDTESGHFVGQLIPLNYVQLKPTDKYKLTNVSVSDTHVCLTVTTETSYLFIADVRSCRFLFVQGLEGRSSLCEITPNSQYVFCGSKENLLAWNLETLEKVNDTQLQHKPQKIIFNKDVSRAFLVNGMENRLYMMTLSGGAVDFLYKVNLHDMFDGDYVKDIKLSHNQELLMIRGNSIIVVYHIEPEKILCHFKRPADIPNEFKLPSSYYANIDYSQADFSPDDKFVIATIFRNIFIWHISNNRLLTSLQAPVGLIEDLLIPLDRGQVVTHQDRSDKMQVWSLGDAIGHVGMLDRLTNAVDEIVMTKDDQTAFVKCKCSDEIGVLNMATGQLRDLLTHESPVMNIAVSVSGQYLFVALKDAKRNMFNKIWHIPGRRVIYEFGDIAAKGVALGIDETFIIISQTSSNLNAPSTLSLITCSDGTFNKGKAEHNLACVLNEPFITFQDKYVVMLTADTYNASLDKYTNTTICAISLAGDMNLVRYGSMELQDTINITSILHVAPCPNNSYNVVVIYTTEPDPQSEESNLKVYEQCYGCMIFDVCSGVVCQLIDDFLVPSTPLKSLCFSDDLRCCIDHQSNVFNLFEGAFVKKLMEEDIAPQKFILGRSTAIFVQGPYISAIRISDKVCIAHVHAHGIVTSLSVCHDDRTIVAGRADGALVSYVLIDRESDGIKTVLSSLASRKDNHKSTRNNIMTRMWDRVDMDSGVVYSRPPSAMLNNGPNESDLLQHVCHIPRMRPQSETMVSLTNRSRACSIM